MCEAEGDRDDDTVTVPVIEALVLGDSDTVAQPEVVAEEELDALRTKLKDADPETVTVTVPDALIDGHCEGDAETLTEAEVDADCVSVMLGLTLMVVKIEGDDAPEGVEPLEGVDCALGEEAALGLDTEDREAADDRDDTRLDVDAALGDELCDGDGDDDGDPERDFLAEEVAEEVGVELDTTDAVCVAIDDLVPQDVGDAVPEMVDE